MKSQKEAVFNAIVELFGHDGQSAFEATKEQRAQIIEMVTTGISNGTVEFSADAKAKYDTEAKVKGYVSGMVSNWLRKDTRLNGGEKYVTKNPGSRAGAGDEVLKNLKAFKTTLGDDEAAIAAVDAEIEKRQAFLKSQKQKEVKINIDLLPEELKHLVNQ